MRNREATFRHILATSLHRKNYGAEYIFNQEDKALGVKTLILTDRQMLFGCGLPQGL